MKIVGDSLVLAKTGPGYLCFDQLVNGTVVVRGTYRADQAGSVVYKEDVDYTVNYARGTVNRTPASTIPDYSTHILHGLKDFNHNKFTNYSNHPFFVWVDYITSNGKPFAKPNNQAKFLTRTRTKLTAGGPFKIVSYGDSITAGGEASESDLRFTTMYGKYLQSKFPKAKIDVQDVSIPGYSSNEGIAWFDDYVQKTMPDLVLVGFGMNDHNIGTTEPDKFQKNLVTIVTMIRARKGADVILFSAFPPNDDWFFGTHRMGLYAEATRRAAAEAKCAYVNIWDTWDMVLKRKNQSALLGNNINHPNDFGHWMYAQAFEAMTF